MKKHVLNALLLGALVSGASTEAADCFPCQPACCELSLCDGKVFVGADYLWWKTEQDGIIIGTTTVAGNQGISTGGSSSSNGSTVTVPAELTTNSHPKFEFDSGYRVYAVYEFPCDQWELGIAYTSAPSSSNSTTLTTTPAVVVNSSTNISSITGKWNANLNILDLDVGKTLKFGECFRLRPHVGFRALWGDQKFHSTTTHTLFALLGAAPNLVVDHYNQKNNGYGLEGGVYADWNFGYGLSLVGHVGGSILYNTIKTHHRSDIAVDIASVTTFISSTTESQKIHTATPTIDYFLGVKYGNCMCDYSYNLYVGYEAHVFFDYGRLIEAGNYSTQGLTAGLNVSF